MAEDFMQVRLERMDHAWNVCDRLLYNMGAIGFYTIKYDEFRLFRLTRHGFDSHPMSIFDSCPMSIFY